jgi:DNA-binding transcriptional ArsR family regulator
VDDLLPVFQSVSRYFSLLAEPTRVRILHSICQSEKTVGQIVEDTGATQTNVSRHLNMLFSAGVLSRRKAGTQVIYTVSDTTLTELCRIVCVRIATQLDSPSDRPDAFRELAAAMGK